MVALIRYTNRTDDIAANSSNIRALVVPVLHDFAEIFQRILGLKNPWRKVFRFHAVFVIHIRCLVDRLQKRATSGASSGELGLMVGMSDSISGLGLGAFMGLGG